MEVELYRGTFPTPDSFVWELVATRTTNIDGNYLFADLPDDHYLVTFLYDVAIHNPTARQVGDDEAIDSDAWHQDVTLAGGDRLDIDGGFTAANPPVGVEDTYQFNSTTFTVTAAQGVLANDSWPQGTSAESVLNISSLPRQGTISLSADGSFTYTYTGSVAGLNDSFQYDLVVPNAFPRAIYGIRVELINSIPGIDVDVDSDNSGEIDRSNREELNEEGPVGLIARPNLDDDNDNGIPDYNESGQLFDAQGNVVLDDELFPIIIAVTGTYDPARHQITVTPQNVRLFANRLREPLPNGPNGGRIEPGEIFGTIGRAQGAITVSLLDIVTGETFTDRVVINYLEIQITAYRPQTEGVGYGNPFPRTEVPHGAATGIRRNGDDDNDDEIADYQDDRENPEENDLVETRVSIATSAPDGALVYALNGSEPLRFFREPSKGYSNRILPIVDRLNAGDTTVWVEWAGGGNDAAMSVSAIDASSLETIDGATQDFYAFNSVVIVALGEFQVPSPNPPPDQGLMRWAIEQYANGWDVHAYDESDFLDTASRIAIPFAEIRSAVNHRGVSNVSLIGYSHGGGYSYELSVRLSAAVADGTLGPFVMPFTSYIDAVQFGQLNPLPESRRPLLGVFHLNQYQTNQLAESFWLHGTNTNGDIEVDRSGISNHTTIDDSQFVLDLLSEWFRRRVTQ